MTCICGVASKGEVFIGGDSAALTGWAMTVRSDPKVFINGPFLIGFTSSFRMGQLLRFSFKPPIHHAGVSIDEYMVTSVVDAVRECLKEGGYSTKQNERESGGRFLIGYRGRLFEVTEDYQVGEALDGLAAVGCGDQVACGALYALRDLEPMERIRRALEAAERFSAGVRGPFTVERLSAEVDSLALPPDKEAVLNKAGFNLSGVSFNVTRKNPDSSPFQFKCLGITAKRGD